MRWRAHLYPIVIEQALDVAGLAKLSEEAATEADETGYLRRQSDVPGLARIRRAGYRTAILEVERNFILRLQEAGDLDAEAATIDDERTDAFEPSTGSGGWILVSLPRRLRCPRLGQSLSEAATPEGSAASIRAHTPMSPSS